MIALSVPGRRAAERPARRLRAALAAAVMVAVVVPLVVTSPPVEAAGAPALINLELPRVPTAAEVTAWFGPGTTLPDINNDVAFNARKAGFPVISQATERIYQAYVMADAAFTPFVGFLIRDLGTMRIIGSFKMPRLRSFFAISQTLSGTLPVTFDTQNARIYMSVTQYLEQGSLLQSETLGTAGIVVFDEPALPVDDPDNVTPSVAQPAPHRFIPVGVSVGEPTGDPRLGVAGAAGFEGLTFADGRLFVMTPSTGHVRVNELDPNTGFLKWSRLFRGCSGFWHDSVRQDDKMSYPTMLFTDDALFIPCQVDSAAAVVRVPLDAGDPQGAVEDVDVFHHAFHPDPAAAAADAQKIAAEAQKPVAEQTFRGQGTPYGYYADQNAKRIHMFVVTPADMSVLTFDAEKLAFVGLQRGAQKGGVGQGTAAWGMDRATGRVYTLSEPFQEDGVDKTDGLSQVEGRRTPVVPGVRLKQFSFNNLVMPQVMATDAARGRVFVPDDGPIAQQRFHIVEASPPDPQPPEQDPDRNTHGVAEQSGLTGSSFSADAGGYGARQFIVGGLRGLYNRNFSTTSPETLLRNLTLNQNPPFNSPQCMVVERDIVMGRVTRASMAGTLRSAAATPVDGDAFSRQDVEVPSRCRQFPFVDAKIPEVEFCGTVPAWLSHEIDALLGDDSASDCTINVDDVDEELDEQADQDWPWPTLACTPDAPNAVAQAEGIHRGSEARVDCAQEHVVAVADFRPTAALLPDVPGVPRITIGWAASGVTARRDPERGLVTTVESVARGIDIGGIVKIDGVYARAEAWAAGRTQTAKTSYQRVFFGVTAPGFSGCSPCSNQQQQAQAVNGINAALAPFGIEARLPALDRVLAAGTPGGYQAAIQRDELEAVTARVVNGDQLQEVPAFELVRFNDTPTEGRQRQIFQFAGVKANAQYGVFCLRGLLPTGECRIGATAPRPPTTPSIKIVPVDEVPEVAAPLPPTVAGDFYEQPVNGQPISFGPAPGGGGESLLEQILQAPADVLRLLLRNPGEALLFLASASLLGAPFWVARRRALLVGEESS